jgi:hypothetical protein
MAIRPDQPQSIGGVLDVSFRLYKQAIGSVWPLSLLIVLASSPQTIYMLMRGSTPVDPTDPLASLAMFQSSGYWGAALLGFVLTLWVVAALYAREHAIGVDEDLGNGAALQLALGRLLPLVGMTFLFGLAVAVGMVLLLVPGMILLVTLILATNLLVIEGKGPIEALTGSHRLVWGNWWRTTAILTVGFIVVVIIYLALAMVIGIVVPLTGIGSSDPFIFGLVVSFLVGAVINLLVMPYYVALLIAIYWDLKLRREGGDLAARVNALGTA